MSKETNRASASLYNMINEMYRKNIEISRITKTAAVLLETGMSVENINPKIVNRCVESQNADGGFIGTGDTVWNTKLLKHYSPRFDAETGRAVEWLKDSGHKEGGYGRNRRDMRRIPSTGLTLYLLPELASPDHLNWLENTWKTEINSLTYKAAYTLLAFHSCGYNPKDDNLIKNTLQWLSSQQEDNGGFAPWKSHPVGTNVYCTAVALLGFMTYAMNEYRKEIEKAYQYMAQTQLPTGIWRYHEIEDGASWGLLAMTKFEEICTG